MNIRLMMVSASLLATTSVVPTLAAQAKQSLLIPVTADEPLTRPQRTVDYSSATPRAKPSAGPVASAKPLASSVDPSTGPSAGPSTIPSATPIPVAKVEAVSAAAYQQKHLIALDKASSGDNKGAIAILQSLGATPGAPEEERDRVYLSLGRILYRTSQEQAAIDAYRQVRRGSASWLESLEERASAEMRLGHPQEALAALKTVLTPIFQERVLSEPYYLTALAQLRVCDYQAVFKTLEMFKSRFRGRVKTWEQNKLSDRVSALRLRETHETIQKLNLVEAEAIQHVYIDDGAATKSGSAPKIPRTSDQLNFPTDGDADAKEVWLDEVDSYRVTTKGCPEMKPEMTPAAPTSTKVAGKSP